jgi:uncharacterized protein (TIGR02145 family)
MNTSISHNRMSARRIVPAFVFVILCLFLQSCGTENTGALAPAEDAGSLSKKPGSNPPPPPPFFFNCGSPTYNGSFVAGVPTSATVTLSYVNSPGGTYAAWTSSTVNGITLTTPAGTLNIGTGSIVFSASGTPVNPGFYNIPVSINGSATCPLLITVVNAPVSGPTVDPGPTAGSTGVVNFVYKGQSVAYKTVRARDGKIWLQQNLGSPQVAFHTNDEASYGDYFQWGRWDDGHQTANSPNITGGSSLLNPSHISSGNPNFISGASAGTSWWGTGGLATDTWSGSSATSTNGKDPCVALGAGWRSPTAADWQNVKNHEDLEGAMTAFMSNLKLPASGFRDGYGGFVFRNGESFYWSATATGNSHATGLFISDNTYTATLQATERGQGYSCRCVKD